MFAVRPMFASGPAVNPLPGGSVSESAVGQTAVAEIIVRRNNLIEGVGNLSGTHFSHNWHNGPPNQGDSHWVRFTKVTGDNPNIGVALNTWHALTTDRKIGYSVSPGNFVSGSFNIDIATDSAGTNIVCSTGVTKYTMIATADPS